MHYSEFSIHIENLRQSFANRDLEDYSELTKIRTRR